MRSLFFTVVLCVCSGFASAADVVGSVILSFGDNIAKAADGSERVLKRHSDVYASDVLTTGDKGRLQLRFSDHSRLALKPASVFRIDEYQFDQQQPEQGKAIFKLLQGGMRTISGKIGKSKPDNYRLETTVATIGIRGTHYGVQYTEEGVYCETVDGAIDVMTDIGQMRVNAGEGASVSANGAIEKSAATGQTGDYLMRKSTQEDSHTAPTENTQIEATIEQLTEAVEETTESVSSRAPQGALVAVAFTRDSKKGLSAGNGSVMADAISRKPSSIRIDSRTEQGDLVRGFTHLASRPNITNHACSPCVLSATGDLDALSESGTLELGGANVTWGRWNADFSLRENRKEQDLDGDFHFMYSDSLMTQAQLDSLALVRSGAYIYSHTSGSSMLTAPQIDTGATGSLNGFDSSVVPAGRYASGTYVVIDWDTQQVEQVSISAGIDDGDGMRHVSLTEEAGVRTDLNDILKGGELALTGSCNGGQCTVNGNDTAMAGQLTFDLVGRQAEGAVTSYAASGDNPVKQNITVVGTVLLKDTGPVPTAAH